MAGRCARAWGDSRREGEDQGVPEFGGNLVGGRQVLEAPVVKAVQPGGNLEWGKRWEREERVGFL
jgi:hypothetical protein